MRFWRLLGVLGSLATTSYGASQQELIPILREISTSSKPKVTEWNAFVRVAQYDGAPYVSLVQMAALLNGNLSSNPASKTYLLSLRGQKIKFSSGSTSVFMSGRSSVLDKPTVLNSEGFWVPISFFASTSFFQATKTKLDWPPRPEEPVDPTPAVTKSIPTPVAVKSTPAPTPNPLKAKALRRIVIDPGHGGKDPGAVGPRGTMEKDVNLQVALHLAELLREKYDYEVLLTRMDDTFVPLEERSRVANKHNADLFLSLHCNASTSHRLKGFEVYFLSEHASDAHADAVARFENAALAHEGKGAPSPSRVKQVLRSLEITANINEASVAGALIDQHLAARLSEPSLGVKQAAFYVLRGAHMPSVLVEMAFISNRQEERLLQSSSFRKKMVEGLGAGIAAYDLRKQKERS